MTVSDADVGRLLTQPEGQHLEFKGGAYVLKSFRNYLPQTIAAFANADGGVIIFGQPNQPRASIGEHNPLNGLEAVEPVQRAVKLATEEVEPAPCINTSVHDIHGQSYVVAEIPRGEDPPYIGAGAAMQRVGDRLRTLPPERLREMLSGADGAEQASMLRRILTANDRQARLIEILRLEVARATSTKRQIAFGVGFAMLGQYSAGSSRSPYADASWVAGRAFRVKICRWLLPAGSLQSESPHICIRHTTICRPSRLQRT